MASCSAFLSSQGTIKSLGSWIEEGDPIGWQYRNIPQTKPNVLVFVLSHTLNLPDCMHCVYISTYLGSTSSVYPKVSSHPPIAMLILRVYKGS